MQEPSDVMVDPPIEADAPQDVDTHWGPTESFDGYCSTPWQQTTQQDTAGRLSGQYLGAYDGLPVGTLLVMKIIPEHPFRVTSLRAAFVHESGNVRLRLMRTFGRSYPDIGLISGDLMPPQQFEVTEPNAETWIEIDVSEHEVFLEPTQHYALVFEQIGETPLLAVESVPEGQTSRALMLIPGETMPYGSEGNFRMELGGETFCRWAPEQRWFEEDEQQPFVQTLGQYGSWADINDDGAIDMIVNGDRLSAFLGDGKGGFSTPSFNPFPDTPRHTLLVFADIDNDGDLDAFAGANVPPDRDGDGVHRADGDCDDADPNVKPGAKEIMGNGIDDDCDGVVDDGTSMTDEDGDGVSVAQGDCNDQRADVCPGAPELLDGRDNDCDGEVDEDFVNRILISDGAGVFRAVASAGVEVFDPSAAAAFGDGNADGILDLYWGNWLVHYPNPASVADVYMQGRGDGTFVDRSQESGVGAKKSPCYGVLWNDYDNDGDQDIWVGNYGYSNNLMWNNDGTGTFTDVGVEIGIAKDSVGYQGGNTFGGDFGDIDNDGDLDLFAANIAHPRYQPNSDISMLLINQGPPAYSFVDERASRGLVYDEGDVNGAFADFDHDGALDLAVASLYPGHFSRLYHNDGTGHFTDVSYEANVAVEDAVTVAWADVDHDGDLDLLVVDRSGPRRIHLFINRVGQQKPWIQLDLRGVTTNRGAVGARVTLTAGGITQVREVRAGGGHNVQSDRIVHFGLGEATEITSLQVRWVGGSTETIQGLTPRHRYRVEQGTGMGEIVF